MQDKIAQTAKPTYNQEDIYGGLSPTLHGVHPLGIPKQSNKQINLCRGNAFYFMVKFPPKKEKN